MVELLEIWKPQTMNLCQYPVNSISSLFLFNGYSILDHLVKYVKRTLTGTF